MRSPRSPEAPRRSTGPRSAPADRGNDRRNLPGQSCTLTRGENCCASGKEFYRSSTVGYFQTNDCKGEMM
jgi:hypothetical protein